MTRQPVDRVRGRALKRASACKLCRMSTAFNRLCAWNASLSLNPAMLSGIGRCGEAQMLASCGLHSSYYLQIAKAANGAIWLVCVCVWLSRCLKLYSNVALACRFELSNAEHGPATLRKASTLARRARPLVSLIKSSTAQHRRGSQKLSSAHDLLLSSDMFDCCCHET